MDDAEKAEVDGYKKEDRIAGEVRQMLAFVF